MKRLPVFLVALVAVLAAACSSSTGFTEPPAATVNGTDISHDSVIADLDALASSEAVRQNLEEQGVEIFGPTEGSYSTEVSAQVLSSRIIDVLIEDEMNARGVTPTPDEIAEAETNFEGFDDLSEDFKASQVDSLANRAALTRSFAEGVEVEPVTDEAVQAYYDENIGPILEQSPDLACASHILVDTQEEADAVSARLAAGEDYAVVAAEVSIDPGSGAQGGDLGCQESTAYVDEFKTAIDTLPVGEVSDPIQTEFGFHIILVRSRDELPFDEVSEDIRALLEQQTTEAGSTAFDEWLARAAQDAEVTVDPFFGSWTPETYPSVVTPPEGSEPAPEPSLELAPETGEVPAPTGP